MGNGAACSAPLGAKPPRHSQSAKWLRPQQRRGAAPKIACSQSPAAGSDPHLWRVAARKLSTLDYATDLRDLSTPGNNLEKLKGALAGKYSIRINDQFRLVFNFDRGEASSVIVTDYH